MLSILNYFNNTKGSNIKNVIPFTNKPSDDSTAISKRKSLTHPKTNISLFNDYDIAQNNPLSRIINKIRLLYVLSPDDIILLKSLDHTTLYKILLEYNLSISLRTTINNQLMI